MKRNQRQAPVARPVGYVPPARRGPLPGACHAGKGEEQKHRHPLFATLTTRSECVRFAAAHVAQVGEAVQFAGGAMPRLERRYGWHLVQKGQSRACLSPRSVTLGQATDVLAAAAYLEQLSACPLPGC